MKTFFLFSLLFLSTVCLGQPDEQIRNSITVTEEAVKQVEPNIGYLDFQISTVDDDILQAKSMNDQKVKMLIQYLKKQKFGAGDITTSTVFLGEHREYTLPGQSSRKQYKSNNYFRIAIRDLSKYEEVSSELIKMGASGITSLSLSHTALESLKLDLLGKALEKARKKAEIMAGKLGLTLGKAIQIFDEQSFTQVQRFDNRSLNEVIRTNPNDGPDSLPLGTLSITTKVRVIFALE